MHLIVETRDPIHMISTGLEPPYHIVSCKSTIHTPADQKHCLIAWTYAVACCWGRVHWLSSQSSRANARYHRATDSPTNGRTGNRDRPSRQRRPRRLSPHLESNSDVPLGSISRWYQVLLSYRAHPNHLPVGRFFLGVLIPFISVRNRETCVV
jgi:hypothetical protein